MILLQDIPIIPADSVKQGAKQMIEYAKTDPEGFWQIFLDKLTEFGLKLLAALLIFIIGIWLIRWTKSILKRVFERRNTEKTIASLISYSATLNTLSSAECLA
jgi:small conductance mechanosensitive channel